MAGSLFPRNTKRSGPWCLPASAARSRRDILKEDQGPEHLHLLHRIRPEDDGGYPGILHGNNVRNFYSVSISGYHIAEAGANPISQLTFTLANGFTYVEYYLSRGMDLDKLRTQPVLFLLQRHGARIHRHRPGWARRIWAVAMREKYGASERSQKLKYHIQTSGRSPPQPGHPVQRYPDDAPGPVCHLRQLQQPPHQCL